MNGEMDIIGVLGLLTVITCFFFVVMVWITIFMFFVDVPKHLKKLANEQERTAIALENINENLTEMNQRESRKDFKRV